MSTTVSSTGTAGYQSTSSSTPVAKKELGKDDFLKLFVTRLRYQNPLEPVNDEQFISQMAQFTSLEQMQNMNTSLTDVVTRLDESKEGIDQLINLQSWGSQYTAFNQAVSLLGKEVTLAVDGTPLTGVVQSVVSVRGVPKLVVNDQPYDLGQVTEVNLPVNSDAK